MLRSFTRRNTVAGINNKFSSLLVAAATTTSSSALRFCSTTSSTSSSSSEVPTTHQAQPGPYEKVGNIFFVACHDIPAKYTPQINLILRELRLEFRGSFTIHPDTPQVREKLFRVRHVVQFEMVPLDEVKDLIGMPQHVQFSDLEMAGLNALRQTGSSTKHPYLRSMHRFLTYRKDRLKEIFERDQVEKRLLEARKKQFASSSESNDETSKQ